ncbi:MAG: hypothetical protein QW735_02045 [archaeon]
MAKRKRLFKRPLKTEKLKVNYVALYLGILTIIGTILLGKVYIESQKTESKVTVLFLGFDCKECILPTFDMNFKFENKSIPYKDSDEYIEKYNISKLPAIIVYGDFVKDYFQLLNESGLRKIDEKTYVIETTSVPFMDAKSKVVRGLINAVEIYDENCSECFNFSSFIENLKARSIKIVNYTRIDYRKTPLTKEYNISLIPTLFLSEDAYFYKNLLEFWINIGSFEKSGLLTRTTYPPFLNLSSKEYVGFVELIEIKVNSCPECFNVTRLESALRNRVKFRNITTYDYSEKKAKELIKKYNISFAPTILLSKDIYYYGFEDLDYFGELRGEYWVFTKIIQNETFLNLSTYKYFHG